MVTALNSLSQINVCLNPTKSWMFKNVREEAHVDYYVSMRGLVNKNYEYMCGFYYFLFLMY